MLECFSHSSNDSSPWKQITLDEMPTSTCPNCKFSFSVRADAGGSLACPKCHYVFELKNCGSQGALVRQAGDDFFDSLTSKHPTFAPSEDDTKTSIILSLALGVVICGLMSTIGIVVFIMSASKVDILPKKPADTLERVSADLRREADRIEIENIQSPTGPATDKKTVSSMEGEERIMWDLLVRAAQIEPKRMSIERSRDFSAEIALVEKKQRSTSRLFDKVMLFTGEELPESEFWKVPLSNHVPTTASEELAKLARIQAAAILLASFSNALPDPMQGEPLDPKWSRWNCYQIRALHMISELNRDFCRELVAINPKDIDIDAIDKLFDVIDVYRDKLAVVILDPHPVESKSVPFDFLPTPTIYQKQMDASQFLKELLTPMYLTFRGHSRWQNPFIESDENRPTEAEFKLRCAIDETGEVRHLIMELFATNKIVVMPNTHQRYAAYRAQRFAEGEKINAEVAKKKAEREEFEKQRSRQTK